MKVCIIGAGAAGLLAGIASSQQGHTTHIYDSNAKVGRKLSMTGNGRCNVTNNKDIQDFLTHVHKNPRFLYSAFHSFFNNDLLNLLEENGLSCKEEDNGRMFPVTDNAQDVIQVFLSLLKKQNVHIHTQCLVDSLWIEDKTCLGIIIDNQKISYDHIIVTTGGCSYPMTGSDGSGYKWAKESGHTLIEARPALVPIQTSDPLLHTLQGLSLSNVELKMQKHQQIGDLLFTHNGISGPLVINMSDSYIDKETLYLDLQVNNDLTQVQKEVLERIQNNPNKQIHNVLSGLCAKRFIPILLKKAQIQEETLCHQVRKQQRNKLAALLKSFPIETCGTLSFNQAMVTSGGIDVKCIQPKTMRSKYIENLSFAGEILDIHADTGGYNLQIAFSTGWLAGMSI